MSESLILRASGCWAFAENRVGHVLRNTLYIPKLTSLFYSSNNCKRTKVKTRRKVSVSLRCPHELIMAACCDDIPSELPPPSTSEQLTCKKCCKTFEASTGCRCRECSTDIYYCSRECQVGIK